MTSSIYTEIRKMAVKMLHQAVGILTGSVLQFDNLERKNKKEIVFNIRIPFFEIITKKEMSLINTHAHEVLPKTFLN